MKKIGKKGKVAIILSSVALLGVGTWLLVKKLSKKTFTFDWAGGQASPDNSMTVAGLHLQLGEGETADKYFKVGDKVIIEADEGSTIPDLAGEHEVIALYSDETPPAYKDMIRIDVEKPKGTQGSGKVTKI